QIVPTAVKQYVCGEVFSYLGCDYCLQVVSGPFAPVELVSGALMVCVPGGSTQPHMVRNALLRWYKRQAHELLEKKVKRLALKVGAQPASIEIKTFKARWGSCSINGKLQFNLLIVLAPERIVDYVVVHELCHLLQHNHSAAYWREVERVMPDYRECREWLKVNVATLKV
ncbi:MAG: SprT family zinc-dependent metalloprotease, partial [Desulfuromonadaceae bacterium]|nr:SprT family zinc-dependent metalloprotease [Desulfuromonadaceae bacterium]